MASQNPPNHHVAASLRKYAEKLAAEKAAGTGNPDRMTVADGQGGVTASKGSIPKDPAAGDITFAQPADGDGRDAKAVPDGGPDRLTVADGQGGITANKDSVPTDPGEAELKRDLPADGTTRGISKRAAKLRAALCQASPAMAEKIQKQAAATAAAAGTPAAKDGEEQIDKRAGDTQLDIDLSAATLAKIASAVMSTDEGVRFVHDTLEKQAGEAAARVQIQEAIAAAQMFDHTEQVKSAAFDDLGNKAYEIHAALQSGGVTEEDASEILKQASLHQEKMASLGHPLLKQAYAQGMDDAALLAAADDAAGEEGVPPVEEAMPMGGEQLSEEEIMALLEEMLASGQITEEDILEAVAMSQGGGGELGADPLAGAPVEELPAEEPVLA